MTDANERLPACSAIFDCSGRKNKRNLSIGVDVVYEKVNFVALIVFERRKNVLKLRIYLREP